MYRAVTFSKWATFVRSMSPRQFFFNFLRSVFLKGSITIMACHAACWCLAHSAWNCVLLFLFARASALSYSVDNSVLIVARMLYIWIPMVLSLGAPLVLFIQYYWFYCVLFLYYYFAIIIFFFIYYSVFPPCLVADAVVSSDQFTARRRYDRN